MSILSEPESQERRRSLVTLMRAVSVLCLVRKPDWSCSKRLLDSRYVVIWLATTRSRIFDRKGRFEMGR